MALTDKLTAIADAVRAKTGKTDKLTLDAIPEEIAGLSVSEAIAHADIPDYVKAAALEVARKVQAVQTNDSITFLAMADSHHCGEQSDTGWQEYTNIGNLHAGMAAKILAYVLKMDFACHLGDITFGHGTTTSALLHQQIGEMNTWLDEAWKGIPQLRTVGNHDTGIYAYTSGTEAELEDAAYLFSAFGAYCEGAVYGSEEYGYCYRDFEDKKLRVICLNTSEGLTEAGYSAGFECSPEQLLWFAQTLYEAGGKAGWNVIVLSHYPLDYLGTYPASDIVKAYVEGGSTTQNGTTVDFSGHNAATFVAQFHGHTHCFKYAKLNTINTSSNTATEYDAWRVAVPNSGFYRNNHQEGPDKYGLYFEDSLTYDKTMGGAEDTAFVVNVVIPSQQIIHSFCYGAGIDRVIGYAATVYYPITTKLTNVTLSNDAVSAAENESYTATVTASEGYELSSVVVTMGGVDITDSCCADGVISIPAVTGEVVITAYAMKPVTYTNLVPLSIDTDGTVFNGVGYRDGGTLNSNGETYDDSMHRFTATGFIPLNGKTSPVFRFAGSAAADYTEYGWIVVLYDASFTKQVHYRGEVWSNNGSIIEEDTTSVTWQTNQSAFADATYVRFGCRTDLLNGTTADGANLIVTMDESID